MQPTRPADNGMMRTASSSAFLLGRLVSALIGAVLAGDVAGSEGPLSEGAVLPAHSKKATWAEMLVASRAALNSTNLAAASQSNRIAALCDSIQEEFPVPWDWALQDGGLDFKKWFSADSSTDLEQQMISRALHELGARGSALQREFDSLRRIAAPPSDPGWWSLYFRACEQRRARRLATILALAPRIVFTKRPTLQPSFFAYTEGQSDAQNERHFVPGAELCLLEMDGPHGRVRTLLADPEGAIRDPAVSWDGQRVVFAWKKSLDDDDYHLYEMAVASGQIRQLTSGLGFADYEPAYLPNDDLVFASTRCVQTVDCWWTEVSNLYTCDPDGRYLRRLGFDQVHTVCPQVLDDGRVIYTRWDYNDRGQMFPQALFQMNADGTGQTEFYKNNSWFPTTVAHARGIPGTQNVLSILCGHHTTQAGKLAVINPAKGRQENAGVQLVAPVRETMPKRSDAYGQSGDLWQYPYPINERECLVAYAPEGWNHKHPRLRDKGGAAFAIYWMDMEGRRELLVSDPRMPCQQPVPLVARARPLPRPAVVDYRKTTGTYYVQDVYAGPSLAGVPRGTVKKLRVIALEFRAAGVGNNGSIGPSGEALVCTPIAIGNGSWDVKTVLGDARVHEDGSAFFAVPARTPLYFQALDEKNHAVQTMRSWSTLQPGENQTCVGCHESKNTAPPTVRHGATLAFRAGPQALDLFYGPPHGFSFPKEIQPILDRHCIRCHNDPGLKMEHKRIENAVTRERDPVWSAAFRPPGVRAGAAEAVPPDKPAFSLLGDTILDKVAKRSWSHAYLNLTLSAPSDYYEAVGAYFGVFDGRMVNWIGSQSIPTPLPPYAAGACRSELVALLESGHGGAKLTREEMDKIACWIDLLVPYCGDYTEAHAWSERGAQKYQRYLAKRMRMEDAERRNIEAFIVHRAGEPPERASVHGQ
jgi:hypothetical protein